MGVKGARLTVTPRGTTYVTVGSHGFYYRETLSNRSDGRVHPARPISSPPQAESTGNTISSSGSSDLVDSSCERLVQQLNERARRFNPAWILYIASAACLAGLAALPAAPGLSNLPDVSLPLGTERTANTADEYSALTARFGEPDSIRIDDAGPLAPVPVGTARYSTANVKVVFVPIGCVDAYSRAATLRADTSRISASAKRDLKGLVQCVPSSGWTAVGYTDSADNDIATGVATVRLHAMTDRKTTPPILELGNAGNKRKPRPPKPATKPLVMKSNENSRLAAEESTRNLRREEARTTYSRIALLTATLGLLTGGVLAHRRNTAIRQSRLFYELNEAEQQKHYHMTRSLGFLSNCDRVWRIETQSPTYDWKRNAGASSLVRRTAIGVTNANPPRVKTNVPVPCIDLGRSQLYFLPDTILYRDSVGYGAIAYSDFHVSQAFTRFIESEAVPSDALVVDRTWLYVNKSGGPDRRFNNNRQLPVLQLGILNFISSTGLNIKLNTSSPQQSLAFAEARPASIRGAHVPQGSQAAESRSKAANTAEKLLGVSSDASDAEISAAYRHLAQMYHPDKVAGLAPEFQALADKRMKEINAAYEMLRQKHSNG